MLPGGRPRSKSRPAADELRPDWSARALGRVLCVRGTGCTGSAAAAPLFLRCFQALADRLLQRLARQLAAFLDGGFLAAIEDTACRSRSREFIKIAHHGEGLCDEHFLGRRRNGDSHGLGEHPCPPWKIRMPQSTRLAYLPPRSMGVPLGAGAARFSLLSKRHVPM